MSPSPPPHAPIAIIGLGCRFPGGATSARAFWDMLLAGTDAVTEVPRERFDVDALYHPEPGTPGRLTSRFGAFIERHDLFDAAFFGISPREAERMDPQQRLLLEVAWQTFEDAGMPPEHASEREHTGVYVGMMEAAYEDLLFQEPEGLEVLGLNGAGRYGTAGRLSYCLRLSGPCLSVDTACSSSLASVHLAVQSLRTGESTLALAGGAHLLLQPQVSLSLAQGAILAPDGRCKFGDASADGFGRGEGVGLVLLQPLARALAEGRKIYAVIRGSALGSYGPTDVAMARPNAAAQAANTRRAYADAGLPPSSVDYVECHGTGTRAGDGIELGALAEVLGPARTAPLRVGSVKTNFAHLEGASGVAGLMKAALSLRHRWLPASLHFHTPNPKIPWAELPITVQARGEPWPPPPEARPRRAGINSFGMSGTNAHTVLEEAPAAEPAIAQPPAGPALVLLSARSPAALRALAEAYRTAIASGDIHAIARATALGRPHLEHRAALVGADATALDAALEALARGAPHAGLHTGRTPPPEAGPGRTVFVFSGHGSQWLGMGRQLAARSPAFRASLEASDGAIRAVAGWSLLEELAADPARSRLAHNDVVQPVLFALAVALAAEWRARGVEPDAVVGHSMGEIAAAHVAGALSLEDAARVVTLRSQLLNRVTGHGGMVMVELPAAEARRYEGGGIAVAVEQSARACVLSGPREPLGEVVRQLEAQGVFCRWVRVDYASHGPGMEPLQDALLEALGVVRPRAGAVPIYSTYLGRRIDGHECDARYWYENLRRPVLFAGAIEALRADGHRRVVEVSPHPLLGPAIGGDDVTVVSSLRREEDELRAMQASLGALWAAGQPVRWAQRYPGSAPLVDLPLYPFQGERYWFRSTPRRAPRAGHPLLGPVVRPSYDARRCVHQVELSAREPAFLAQHEVQGAVVLPGAAMLEMARAIGEAAGRPTIAEVEFVAPLVLGDGARRVEVAVAEGDVESTFTVSSQPTRGEARWTLHARGALRTALVDRAPSPPIALGDVRARLGLPRSAEALYAELAALGLGYGPAFRGVREAWSGPGEALARVEAVERDAAYALHPAGLDACLHTLLIAAGIAPDAGPSVPVRVGELVVRRALPKTGWAHARVTARMGARTEGELTVFDDRGEPCVELRGLVLEALERRTPGELWFALDRAPVDPPPPKRSGPRERWLLVGGGLARELAARLEAAGEQVTVAAPSAAQDALGALASGERWRGVVHLAAAELGGPVDPEAIVAAGPLSVSSLVQALARAATRESPRLWLVGRADGEALLAGAPLIGLARVLGYEHPELRPTHVELSSAAALERLAALLTADPPGDAWAASPDGLALVQLVRRRPPLDRAAPPIRADRSYLITGGLGGLGRALARDLVERGARHLVLLGRRAAPDPALEAELAPARARLVAVDVADRAALAAVIASIEPPLAGVYHAAAVLDDGLLVEQTAARHRAVLGPKLFGAWHLHALTEGLPLEAFVLYGSAAALVGTAGQSGYAAGNAFLDGLARYRAARGLCALSVDWGAFSEVGLAAADESRGERLRARGMGSVTPGEGLRALMELRETSAAQVGVMRFDARPWVEFHPQIAGSTYLARLLADAGTRAPAVGLELGALTGAARRAALEAFVADAAGRVLRLDPDKLGRGGPLKDVGLDSLMGLELRNRLERGTGLKLQATLLWVHPSVAALAEFLDGQLAGAGGAGAAGAAAAAEAAPLAATPVAAEDAAPIEARLSGLSEAEKEALLLATLAELES